MEELTVKEYLRKKTEAEIAINLAIKVIINDFQKYTGFAVTGISTEIILHNSARGGHVNPDPVAILSTNIETSLED